MSFKELGSARRQELLAALAEAREKARLTQRDAAKRLGVAQSVLAKIESGERYLSVFELIALCETYGVDPRSVITRVMEK